MSTVGRLVVADLKKTPAWKWFSLWVRLRDCRETTTIPYVARCITCGRPYHYKDLHAGHFVKAIHRSVFFDEQNVHAQCNRCNTYLDGNEAEYLVALTNKYGRATVDRLLASKLKIRKFTGEELVEISARYRFRVKQLQPKAEER